MSPTFSAVRLDGNQNFFPLLFVFGIVSVGVTVQRGPLPGFTARKLVNSNRLLQGQIQALS